MLPKVNQEFIKLTDSGLRRLKKGNSRYQTEKSCFLIIYRVSLLRRQFNFQDTIIFASPVSSISPISSIGPLSIISPIITISTISPISTISTIITFRTISPIRPIRPKYYLSY